MPDDHELSPEQERVRALLAQARVDTPIPDDVAERLDRVLARLAEEEVTPHEDVVTLASRRRRRATTLLVAAAAVVVVGVGIGTVVPDSMDGSEDSASAPQDAALEKSAPTAAADGVGVLPESTSSRLSSPVPRRVRPDHFADDVARLRAATVAAQAGAAESDPVLPGDSGAQFSTARFICDPAPWGPGRLVAVRYSGVPAILAFRPPAGDTQVAELLECGTAAILRSVTLPAP